MVLLSIVDIQKIWIVTKFGGCSSKIEPATPILILKFKRAWQTQFFSQILQIKYLQMIVKPYFADFAGIEFGKKMIQSSVQV